MRFFKKIGSIKRTKLISYILLIIILIYGLSFSILFIIVSNSVLKTIGSIRIPYDYYLGNLDPSNPELEFSFRIKNMGFTDIADFSISVSEDLLFFEQLNETERRVTIFHQIEYYGTISPMKNFIRIFVGNDTNFNKVVLNNFWDKVNLSKGVRDLLTIEMKGYTFFGLVPFKILIDDFCIVCGGL